MCPLDTEIVTPFGFRRMLDMRVGSEVSNPDGTVSRVIAVYPQGKLDIYRVSFSDGSSTEVGLEHLWSVKVAYPTSKWKLMTTKQIIDTGVYSIRKKGNEEYRNNKFLIPMSQPTFFNDSVREIPLHPYILGALLGDGSLGRTSSIELACLDGEIANICNSYLALDGYFFRRIGNDRKYRLVNCDGSRNNKYIRVLKELGLWFLRGEEKFIPDIYKKSSIENRFLLLSSLLDTDGCVDSKFNRCHFSTTSKKLAEDVKFLVCSLGGTCSINSRQRDIPNRKCEYYLYINISNFEIAPFKYSKKIKVYNSRKKLCLPKRKIVDISYSRKAESACITIDNPNGLYMQGDFIVTHNSVVLLAAGLQYCECPGYSALIVRDSFANLAKPEGLMDVSHEWLTGTDAKWKDANKTWEFPSGATLSFGHLDGPRSHFAYQGSAFHYIGIDEVVAIPKNQGLYLFSRLRRVKGMSNVPLRFRCASNPPSAEQIATGAWVKERYVDPRTRKHDVIFIPAKMTDNQHLDIDEYRIALSNLDHVTRMQLEEGDWDIAVKGRLFDSDWFVNRMVDFPPDKVIRRIRFWDLAATEPSSKNRDPDYTAGVKVSMTSTGIYFLEHVIRFRKTPSATEMAIQQIAEFDGKSVEIRIEQESGSSGKITIDHYIRNVLRGYEVRGNAARGLSALALSKVRPVSSACEAELVYMVRGAWNQDFIDELTSYCDSAHDDQVAAFINAFVLLSSTSYTPRLGCFGGYD